MSSLFSPEPPDAPSYKRQQCGVCSKACGLSCTKCSNIVYCSLACEKSDRLKHEYLCMTWSDFQTRPAPANEWSRCIVLPLHGAYPEFRWQRSAPDSINFWASSWFTGHGYRQHHEDSEFRGIEYFCERDETLTVRSNNCCLLKFIPETGTGAWRSEVVAIGWEYDKKAVGVDRKKQRRPVDLDTRALNPLFSMLQVSMAPGYYDVEEEGEAEAGAK